MAQESEDQASQPPKDEVAEARQQDESQAQTQGRQSRAIPQSTRRTLYFIGPKARGERQLGPAIGDPKSILPTPFVPYGSIQVPEIIGENDTPEAQVVGAPVEQGANSEGPTQQSSQTINPGAQAQENTQTTPEPSLQEPSDGAVQLDPFGGILQERSLERLDPSGIPVRIEDNAQGVETIWQGYSRQDISSFLERLSGTTSSPVLKRMAAAVAASRLTLPAPQQDSDIINTIMARLNVFEASGNVAAYVALLDALPADRDWSALAQHQARAHLLTGALTDACAVAESQRAVDVSAYWVRLEAFCMAAAGDRAGVDFQLGILEETRSLDVTFYQLLDQILIEAERPAGSVIPEPSILSAPLKIDIVPVAMARLARVRVNEVDTSDVNTLAVPMLLQNPSLSQNAQIALLDIMLSRGVADGETLASAAQSLDIDPVVLQRALTVFIPDDGQDVSDNNDFNATTTARATDESADAIDAAPDTFDPELGKTLAQMTLLAVIAQETDLSVRMQALNRLWDMSVADGNISSLAPTISSLTASWDADSLSADGLDQVLRASVLSGTSTLSGRLRTLRTIAAGENAVKDAALLRLWPLIALQENSDFDLNTFQRWWLAMEADENKFIVANSLLTMFEGFGFNVPDQAWLLIEGGPSNFEGVSIAPAFWRKLQHSADAQDPVATLTSVYDLFGNVQVRDLPPSIAGVLMRSMDSVGFSHSAKAIAADILISQGL